MSDLDTQITGVTAAAHGGVTIELSLISHTNAGKTTLARTLLGRDVGEVRDAAHVTDLATGYVLVQEGADTLMLWDTPGFGDTARLLKRLKLAGNPIGWLLSQVWDRFRERALWSSQQAVKNAREQADVILYLVNSSDDPGAAGYISLEMEVLAWIGKPVVVLLNQMGPPRADTSAEIARWSGIGAEGLVRAVVPLDAFARCWVQEGALLDTVAPLLPPAKAPAMAALRGRWEALNRARFDASMAVIGHYLAQAAADQEAVDEPGWQAKLAGKLTGRGGGGGAAKKAMTALAGRLGQETTRSTEQLIGLHGLSGKAARTVLERVGDDYAHSEKTPEGAAAALGGLVSGAVGGLAADLAAGGLTLGGGMIIGGILGALGATGVARSLNLARGEDGSAMRWSGDFFERLTVTALLRYLAVAHFGRGRGDWTEGEHPAFWQAIVEEAVAAQSDRLRRVLRSVDTRARSQAEAQDDLTAIVTRAASTVLTRLYPQAMQGLKLADGTTCELRQAREAARERYQRITRGPISPPSPAARPMPSVYQVSTNSADTSGQCRQYSVAAQAPAASPAAAPAARSRVGASRRNDCNNPAKIGSASSSTSHGQRFQVAPSHIASQSAGGAHAISAIVSTLSAANGSTIGQNRHRPIGSGRASRAATISAPTPSEIV